MPWSPFSPWAPACSRPPFGVGFYAACAIAKVSPDVAMPRIWPYIGALLIGLALVVAFPWLSIGFL